MHKRGWIELAMMLFDTGATHSFIAQSFVEHHGIRTNTLKKCMHRESKVQCKSDGDRHQGY